MIIFGLTEYVVKQVPDTNVNNLHNRCLPKSRWRILTKCRYQAHFLDRRMLSLTFCVNWLFVIMKCTKVPGILARTYANDEHMCIFN